MASDDLMAAEAEWRQQFAAMQAALADLKLPQPPQIDGNVTVDDDDFDGYSSGVSGRDVWDFISDEEDDEYSSDFVDEHNAAGYGGTSSSGSSSTDWFSKRCAEIASKNGLSADVFETQITSLVASGRPDDELQAHLTDLVGFDDLDFIIEVLSRKDEVVSASKASQPQETGGHRLMTKAEREAALRRQDYDHKTASLAAASKKEPQYPHVYKAYHAGNTLSASGKKYGLPVGSERLQFEKYEEYSVPAARKGTLGPGEKLVRITDLDGLCRNTFKGYKTLNRMQSLVYPVAYKSNENMLICAPTGAVSTERSPFHVSTTNLLQ